MNSRIERGVKFCNKTYGKDWPCRINLEELDLGSPQKCVLGQLEGDFWKAVTVYNLPADGRDYGFWPLERGDRVQQWREVIVDLRRERGCADA